MGPPPGVSPNFVDPKNRTDIYIAVYAIFTSLVLLFVSLRLYAKICIIRSIGWDDCESATIRYEDTRADGSSFLRCRNCGSLAFACTSSGTSLIENRSLTWLIAA